MKILRNLKVPTGNILVVEGVHGKLEMLSLGDYTTIYPYKNIEKNLKNAGYDVLVFVASEYEDMGRITCGNAILSGTLPEVPYEELKI